MSHAGEIYTRILEKRLRACVEGILNDSQYVFSPGRGTTDAIFVMKMILEKGWEWVLTNMPCFSILRRLLTE